MNRNRSGIALAIGAVLMIVTTVVAADDDPSGRIVAARGNRDSVEGTLLFQHDEWFVVVTEGSQAGEWELHLGPYGHLDTPPFVTGETAVVDGFVYTDHISPITVSTATKVHQFWQDSRLPQWAGEGTGGGRVAHSRPEIPTGERMATQQESVDRNRVNTPPGLGRNRN